MKFITAFSRIFIGVLFIISGLIKANDPLGFSYKLNEYFTVFNTPVFINISVALAMIICIVEVGLGVATLMGYKMKTVSVLLLLMIVFFSFLTFYSAWFDVVKDCGCFGDALHLTPWQSFTKDIVLLVFVLVLFTQRKKIQPLISERASALTTFAGFALCTWFTMYCYNHLPVKDFRPYAIGKNIKEGMVLPPGAVTDSIEMVFIYEKDGKQVELSTAQISNIDETYKYVDRKDKVLRVGDKPPIHDFAIRDASDADYTDDFLSRPYVLMLVAYDLEHTNESDKVQGQINDLAKLAAENDIEFFGMTSTVPAETDKFRHKHQNMFPYYYCDVTALKTIIRSNPGLVLLKKGTVAGMWHYNDFPSFDELKKNFISSK